MSKHDLKSNILKTNEILSREEVKIRLRNVLSYLEEHPLDDLDLVYKKYVDDLFREVDGGAELLVLETVEELPTVEREDKLIAVVVQALRGGAFSYRDTLDPGQEVDNGIIFDAEDGGYWVRHFSGDLNVQWFGVIEGEGINNNDSIIQAINTHQFLDKWLYFPSGVWDLNNLNVSSLGTINGNLRIKGESKNATVIRLPTSPIEFTGGFFLESLTMTGHSSNYMFRFDQNLFVEFPSTSFRRIFYINNCVFDTFRMVVFAFNSSSDVKDLIFENSRITNNVFKNCLIGVIYLRHKIKTLVIENNEFDDVFDQSVYVSAIIVGDRNGVNLSSGVKVHNNVFRNMYNPEEGDENTYVVLAYSYKNIFSGNTLIGCARGLYSRGDGGNITGNTFSNPDPLKPGVRPVIFKGGNGTAHRMSGNSFTGYFNIIALHDNSVPTDWVVDSNIFNVTVPSTGLRLFHYINSGIGKKLHFSNNIGKIHLTNPVNIITAQIGLDTIEITGNSIDVSHEGGTSFFIGATDVEFKNLIVKDNPFLSFPNFADTNAVTRVIENNNFYLKSVPGLTWYRVSGGDNEYFRNNKFFDYPGITGTSTQYTGILRYYGGGNLYHDNNVFSGSITNLSGPYRFENDQVMNVEIKNTFARNSRSLVYLATLREQTKITLENVGVMEGNEYSLVAFNAASSSTPLNQADIFFKNINIPGIFLVRPISTGSYDPFKSINTEWMNDFVYNKSLYPNTVLSIKPKTPLRQSVISTQNYTASQLDTLNYNIFTGSSGDITVKQNEFEVNNEYIGEVEGGAKTVVGGTGVTVRTSNGSIPVIPTGSVFKIKFKSPNDCLLTIYGEIIRRGTTAQRPTNPPVGFQYFDTTINSPVWYDGTDWLEWEELDAVTYSGDDNKTELERRQARQNIGNTSVQSTVITAATTDNLFSYTKNISFDNTNAVLRGLAGTPANVDGDEVVVNYIGTGTLTIVGQATQSSAANRFLESTILYPNTSVRFKYFGSVSRWVRVSDVTLSGTFTPLLATSGTGFSGITYALQEGLWVRQGNVLHVTARVEWSAISGGSGTVSINNASVPAPSGIIQSLVVGESTGINVAADYFFGRRTTSGSGLTIQLNKMVSGVRSGVQASELASSGLVEVSGVIMNV